MVIKKSEEHWGLCEGDTKVSDKFIRLEISDTFPNFSFFLSVLSHEMIHAYQYLTIGKVSHAKSFTQWEDLFSTYGLEILNYEELD